MIARFLTLFFTFATFAAPGLCCCPVEAAAAGVMPEPTPSACSCCHVAKPAPQPQPQKKPPAKSPLKQCVCTELCTAPMLPTAPFDAGIANSDWPVLDFFSAPTSVHAAEPATGFRSRRPIPYPIPLAGRRLLAVYSTLNC